MLILHPLTPPLQLKGIIIQQMLELPGAANQSLEGGFLPTQGLEATGAVRLRYGLPGRMMTSLE
jgi:hypothetical protein